MSSKSNLFNPGIWYVKLLFAVLIAALLLLGANRPSSDSGVVSAAVNMQAVIQWNAVDQKGGEGIYSYLRQIPVFQKKDGTAFSFYATKSIWVFGEGQAMLIEWVPVPEDLIGKKFKIKFAYLDKADVNAISAAGKVDRDNLIKSLTKGALTQTTSAVFNGQAGLYLEPGEEDPGKAIWLPEIILNPALTPQLDILLRKAKYPPGSLLRQANIAEAQQLIDDLALDAQIYPAAGIFQNDTRLAIYFPGYTPGVPFDFFVLKTKKNDNSTKAGWNNIISMGKDPGLWMHAQGLDYDDMVAGNRRWGVVMGWNSHLDYDGQHTASKGVAADEPLHVNYVGMLTPVGRTNPGLVKRAMAILHSEWAGVPLNGDRNVVSHSTGYYLAMDLLHYMETMWPPPSKTRFFAISPNIRGSTIIGAKGAPQAFDSQDDMYRDNWHWNEGYRKNETTLGILNYRPLDDVEAHVMLAYGDMTSAGVGGNLAGFFEDVGVVDYSNYQPHQKSIFEDIDDHEYGRRHRFSPYESLFNLFDPFNGFSSGDGGQLDKGSFRAEWENGGDEYLRNFPNMKVSVFGKNVNLGNQGADDSEKYQKDHSELAQRMMLMKLTVGGETIDYLPAPGKPTEVVASDEKPGVVKFSWLKSPNQLAPAQDTGEIGGQLYEIVRRIEGNEALEGWEDKWWQRVALQRADGGSQFDIEYKSYETIRGTKDAGTRFHGLWTFTTADDAEVINVPTWLDQSFNFLGLWVRVLNGPLEGGFFEVEKVQDYLGIGYKNAGALGNPASFPNKLDITLLVANNTAFGFVRPEADNYLTLGGIKYQYNATFFGPVDTLRSAVTSFFPRYTHEDELENIGTGHFMSIELGKPVTHMTDTISPTISFGRNPR